MCCIAGLQTTAQNAANPVVHFWIKPQVLELFVVLALVAEDQILTARLHKGQVTKEPLRAFPSQNTAKQRELL